MALAKVSKREKEVKENIPVIETAVVVDEDVPVRKMLKYISGMNWTVTYYNSVKRKNEIIEPIDPDKRTIENQYTKIEKLTIKVTSALETETLDGLTGTAIIPVNIIPVVGDMFTARILSGEIGLFTITDVKERSYKLDRTFEINYKLTTTNLINSTLLEEVEQRVVQTFVYEDNVTLDNRNPLLMKDVDSFYREMKQKIKVLSTEYYHRYIADTGYLCLEREDYTVYDGYIVSLFSDLSDLPNSMLFANTRIPETRKYPFTGLLVEGSALKYFKAGLRDNIPVSGYQNGRLREHYPTVLNKLVDVEEYNDPIDISVSSDLLPKMDYGDYSYLYRENGDTLFEIVLKSIVDGEELNYEDVRRLVEDSDNWNDEEFYWYGPLLLYIVIYTVSNIRSHY